MVRLEEITRIGNIVTCKFYVEGKDPPGWLEIDLEAGRPIKVIPPKEGEYPGLYTSAACGKLYDLCEDGKQPPSQVTVVFY